MLPCSYDPAVKHYCYFNTCSARPEHKNELYLLNMVCDTVIRPVEVRPMMSLSHDVIIQVCRPAVILAVTHGCSFAEVECWFHTHQYQWRWYRGPQLSRRRTALHYTIASDCQPSSDMVTKNRQEYQDVESLETLGTGNNDAMAENMMVSLPNANIKSPPIYYSCP